MRARSFGALWLLVAVLVVVGASGVLAMSRACYTGVRISGLTGEAAWMTTKTCPFTLLVADRPYFALTWYDNMITYDITVSWSGPNIWALIGNVYDRGNNTFTGAWFIYSDSATPPAAGWVNWIGSDFGTPCLSGGLPCDDEGATEAPVFVPAYEATGTNVWSLLTRPVPTFTKPNGEVGLLPVVYHFGEVVEVRFTLETGDGRAITDLDVRLDLWKYTAEFEVGIGWRIMSLNVSYDREAGAYATVIPTDGPDFKLLPGFYAWHLVTRDDEELQVLQMIIQ
jgi:hypothetical protein